MAAKVFSLSVLESRYTKRRSTSSLGIDLPRRDFSEALSDEPGAPILPSPSRGCGIDPYRTEVLRSLEVFTHHIRELRLLDDLCSHARVQGAAIEPCTLRDVLGTAFLSVVHGQTAFSQMDALRVDRRSSSLLGFSNLQSGSRVSNVLSQLAVPAESSWARECLHDSRFRPRGNDWVCDFMVSEPQGCSLFFRHAVWDRRRKICLDLEVLDSASEVRARAPGWDFIEKLQPLQRPSIIRGGEILCTEENIRSAEELGISYIFDLPGSVSAIVEEGGKLGCHRAAGGFEGYLRLDGWSRPRRVVFLGQRAAVASPDLSRCLVEEFLRRAVEPWNPFDLLSTRWVWEGFASRSLESARTAACLASVFQNWWSDFAAGKHRIRAFNTTPVLVCKGLGVIPQTLAAVISILLATGIAFTANPNGAERPPPPPQTAAQSDADFLLEPMQPSEPDVGFATIQATTDYPIAPLPDPNVDDVPPLDGEQIGLVQVPEEADDRMWRIRPIVSTGVTYDDNIFISNSDRQSDLIYNINLGFALELGDYRNMESNFLLLEYLAEGFFFNRYASQNSFDQQASLLAQYRFNQLAVQLESRYQFLNGAERQVGAFTTRSLYFNTLRFLYDYSEKTDIDLELSQNTNDYPDNLSSADYQASLAVDYALFPKTKVGLQVIGGLQRTEDSPDMWFQTINARTAYGVTGKVVLNASGGIQFNQYVSGGEPMRVLPVFSLGAEYQLFPKTSLSLVGYRNLQSSPSIAGQDYIATGGEFGISQGLTDKLTFAFAVGYENDTYVANTVDTDATRVDNFYFLNPSLSYSFLKYMKASLSYEYRANASTLQQDTWFDNQFSFELEGQF